MQQDELVMILADISGYTRFMLENRTAAVHGQLCINSLIEAILEQVNIPLTLQEIEGDAVFLYARASGAEAGWQAILREVGQKLTNFFDAFIARTGLIMESTPCGCAICSNSDPLGLKVVVHAGKAVFHEVVGRPQVSGPDVILAHRLLENSRPSNQYLLLTEPAFELLRAQLPDHFETQEETYEGFGRVPVRVRTLERDFFAARDAVYKLGDAELRGAADPRRCCRSQMRGCVNAAQHAVAAATQQLGSVDTRYRLAEYWVDTVGSGQRGCWPLNADPSAGSRGGS